jgi:hypothetical protein
LEKTGVELGGLEWPGWESQNPQRVVKLMEEQEQEPEHGEQKLAMLFRFGPRFLEDLFSY